MSVNLLTQAVEGKWAILPRSLQAISEIIQNHEKIFARNVFHQGEDSVQSIIGSMGTPVQGTRFATRVGSVGILTIDGPIIPRISGAMSGPVASLEAYAADLDTLEADDSIDVIVGSFDSPGGYVTGVSEFADRIRACEKKTVGFVYGYAASAMYWIASAFDELHGSKTCEVGSIGTVALFEDRSKQLDEAGIRRFEIVSNLSPNKRTSVDTPEGEKEVIKILDQITTVFVDDVAKGRKVSAATVLSRFGQGKMFIASEAKELGMIDDITTLSELVKNLNGNTNNNRMEGLMSDSTNKPKVQTAGDILTSSPSVHAEIHDIGFNAGIAAEQTRMKSIEAIKAQYPEAASFIDEKKFEANISAGDMALSILSAKDTILKSAATIIKKEGSVLTKALEPVAAATDDAGNGDAGEEDNSALIAVAVAAANGKHMEIHGKSMGGK